MIWSVFLAVVLLPWPQTQTAETSKTEPSLLRVPDGAPVTLVLERTLSTRTAQSGDAAEFRVMEDVKQDGLVVIAAGAPATGLVATSEAPGRAWKEGHLELRPTSVQLVNGNWAQLSAQAVAARGRSVGEESMRQVGEVATQTSGLGIVLFPLWSLKKGRHAMFLGGSAFRAYLEGALELDRNAVTSSQLPPPPPPRTGPAVIHVYHMDEGVDPPNRTLGLILGLGELPAHAPAVWVGKAGIAFGVKPGESFQFSLPAGEYWIRLHDKKTVQRLQVRDGEEYFVCIWANEPRDPGTSWEQWPDQIKLEPALVGAIRLANTKSGPAKRVKDPASLDPQKLRADPR